MKKGEESNKKKSKPRKIDQTSDLNLLKKKTNGLPLLDTINTSLTKESMRKETMNKEPKFKCLVTCKSNNLSKEMLNHNKLKKTLYTMLKFSRILKEWKPEKKERKKNTTESKWKRRYKEIINSLKEELKEKLTLENKKPSIDLSSNPLNMNKEKRKPIKKKGKPKRKKFGRKS